MSASKLKAQDYIDAIRKTKGNITKAAELLGIARRTMYNARERYVSVQEAIDESRDHALDHVEYRLMQLIDSGDVTATIFFLKTQGKSRGWNERVELAHSGRVSVDLDTLTDEQLARIAAGENPSSVIPTG